MHRNKSIIYYNDEDMHSKYFYFRISYGVTVDLRHLFGFLLKNPCRTDKREYILI
jgi:hypothetical protein